MIKAENPETERSCLNMKGNIFLAYTEQEENNSISSRIRNMAQASVSTLTQKYSIYYSNA